MKLHEGMVGKSYLVTSIVLEDKITRRLEALGVNERTQILVLNKKRSGTIMIKVRGTRLALGGSIADGIEIAEGPKNE